MHETNEPDIATLVYHELRAPLGLVATLARGASCEDDPAELRRQCALIQRTAERMLRTATAVIEAARAARCDDPAWFAPVPVVERAVDDASPAGLRVSYICDPQANNLSIYGSPLHLETLAHSLLSNALDHGDPSGYITVEIGAREGSFTFTMRNPIGQGRGHHGIGAGIVVCHQIMRALGGELTSWREGNIYVTACTVPAAERLTVEIDSLALA